MTLFAPAARLVVPVTDKRSESVIAPSLVTARVPLTVEALRSIALMSLSSTLLPDTTDTVAKLLALSSVMLFAAPPSAWWYQ